MEYIGRKNKNALEPLSITAAFYILFKITNMKLHKKMSSCFWKSRRQCLSAPSSFQSIIIQYSAPLVHNSELFIKLANMEAEHFLTKNNPRCNLAQLKLILPRHRCSLPPKIKYHIVTFQMSCWYFSLNHKILQMLDSIVLNVKNLLVLYSMFCNLGETWEKKIFDVKLWSKLDTNCWSNKSQN